VEVVVANVVGVWCGWVVMGVMWWWVLVGVGVVVAEAQSV
jgi:hypothetical protein